MKTKTGVVLAMAVLTGSLLLIPASQAERSIVPPEPGAVPLLRSGISESTVSMPALAADNTVCTTFKFDTSDNGFTAQNVFGAAPLWHVTDHCRANLAGHSTPNTFYYGQEPDCNYNTGDRNGSNLLSPVLNLTSPATLSFNYLLFVEGGGFDSTFVDVSTDGGSTWTQVISKANFTNDNQWHSLTTDISAAVGNATSIRLRFRFDSVDNIANSTTGWHLDDIQVCGTKAPAVTLKAVEGQPFSNQTVAQFLNPSLPPSNFTATINWGDGTAITPGLITPSVSSVSSVLGSHTYLEEGSYNVTVVIHDLANNVDITVNTPATVSDAALTIGTISAGATTTFSGIGGNNASVAAGTANAAFSAFKAAIGGSDNGGAPPPQSGGFRAINWDGVALDGTDFGGNTTVISPNNVVGIPVNRFQARGVEFESVYAVAGDGFVSVNPSVAGQFPAFSPTKTFAMFNDNFIEFNFVLPSATNTPPIQAVTRGFGAIFLDVETANTTSIEYFNGTTSLGKFFVPVGASGQAEFFGVLFDNPVVSRVKITLGNATLFNFNGLAATTGATDTPPGSDLAVTDDFVYPEPAPVATGININATAGTPFTAKVASFTDGNPNGQVSDFSVVIDWGDGTTSSGGVTPNMTQPDDQVPLEQIATITPNINGGFDVTGTHTYTTTGAFKIVTSIRDEGGASISAVANAVVTGVSQSGTFQFNAISTSAAEGANTVTLTITRTGDTSGAASVSYETSDGTAVQKGDYSFGSGTIPFAPGDTSKLISISLINDVFVEGSQTFFVNLSNPSPNFAIGTPSSIAVTINDDDVGIPIANPIDDPTFFVRQHYLDFLGREPDVPGLNFWVSQITSCGASQGCIAAARVTVSASFFLSIEFQETSGNVIRSQRVAFGRQSADPSLRVPYLQFMRDSRQVGAGVIIGQPGADALLEQNKQAYALQIVNSPAFLARFPITPAATYVDALYASAAVTPTVAERAAAISAFGVGGTLGRVAALRSVVDSTSVKQAELNASFVLAEYFGYLRRNPTDAPDSNDTGYQFWLNKLNTFNGNFLNAEMVKAFITSFEYRQRFGP